LTFPTSVISFHTTYFELLAIHGPSFQDASFFLFEWYPILLPSLRFPSKVAPPYFSPLQSFPVPVHEFVSQGSPVFDGQCHPLPIIAHRVRCGKTRSVYLRGRWPKDRTFSWFLNRRLPSQGTPSQTFRSGPGILDLGTAVPFIPFSPPPLKLLVALQHPPLSSSAASSSILGFHCPVAVRVIRFLRPISKPSKMAILPSPFIFGPHSPLPSFSSPTSTAFLSHFCRSG